MTTYAMYSSHQSDTALNLSDELWIHEHFQLYNKPKYIPEFHYESWFRLLLRNWSSKRQKRNGLHDWIWCLLKKPLYPCNFARVNVIAVKFASRSLTVTTNFETRYLPGALHLYNHPPQKRLQCGEGRRNEQCILYIVMHLQNFIHVSRYPNHDILKAR